MSGWDDLDNLVALEEYKHVAKLCELWSFIYLKLMQWLWYSNLTPIYCKDVCTENEVPSSNGSKDFIDRADTQTDSTEIITYPRMQTVMTRGTYL